MKPSEESIQLTNLIVSGNGHWAALCCTKSETCPFKVWSYTPRTFTVTPTCACGALNDPPEMVFSELDSNIEKARLKYTIQMRMRRSHVQEEWEFTRLRPTEYKL